MGFFDCTYDGRCDVGTAWSVPIWKRIRGDDEPTGRAMRTRPGSALLIATACLSGCGFGGADNVGVPTFNVSGTVSGLTGAGLVLQLNGGGNLGVTTNGVVTLATRLANGAPYSGRVLSQPSTPSPTRTVTDGPGTGAR